MAWKTFKIPVSEKCIDEDEVEINCINIPRAKITSLAFIALETLQLIALFVISGSDIGKKPGIYYASMYSFLLLAMIIFYILFSRLEKDIPHHGRSIKVIAVIFISVILLWCAGISLLDQLSNGQVIVYTVAVICIAVTPYIKPLTLLKVYTIVQLLFLVLMPWFQKSSEILFANYINSTTFVIISWVVSYMRYRKLVEELKNRRIIKAQRDDLKRINKELENANKKLEELSRTDSLTGINNRSFFDKIIIIEWERCKRHFTPLSLLMIDIDHFKAYNDNYGHLAGDDCLRQVAQVLANCVRRSSDVVSRYGGEEFAIILPYLDRDDALKMAEQMKTMVEVLGIPHMYSSVSTHVTISIGVNTVIPSAELTIKQFIYSADKALYEAKEDRNKVVVA